MPIPKEKIIELARKGGFETELKVASILSSSGWQVDQSVYYIDKDENKGRELDIYAYRIFNNHDEKPEVSCLINFCAEVKKTAEPFIFFTSSPRRFEPGSGFSLMHWRHNVDSNVLDHQEIVKRPFGQPKRMARSYAAFKDEKGQHIRSGLLSAVKATVHYTEKCDEKWSSISRDICFFIPVMIVDGPIYECYFDKLGELTVEQVEEIVFMQNYLSPQYGRITQRVHVFSPEAFEKGLKSYAKWGSLIVETLKASRTHVVKGGVSATVELSNS